LINPLAVGVTLGGLLLDILVPRPKPLVGTTAGYLSSPVSHLPEDTLDPEDEQYESPPIASGISVRH
jgi:hypothetical protein